MILVNTNKEIDSFHPLRRFRLGLVDAGPIARKAGVGTTFNTAMLGAYVRLTDLIKMGTLIETVRRMVPAKVEENVRAVKEAFEQTVVYEAQR